jgi:hypothetical protein
MNFPQMHNFLSSREIREFPGTPYGFTGIASLAVIRNRVRHKSNRDVMHDARPHPKAGCCRLEPALFAGALSIWRRVAGRNACRGRRVHQAGAGVTKALPFTVAAIARAIEGARKAGLPITATSVNPDTGVITIHHQDVPVPTVSTESDGEGGDWTDA